MPEVKRAGGYIDRGDGKGWVLAPDEQPEPDRHRGYPQLSSPIKVAGGYRLVAEDSPAAEAERAEEKQHRKRVAAGKKAAATRAANQRRK